MKDYKDNPNSPQLIERIQDGLTSFDVNDRTDWLNVGFALKNSTSTNQLSDPIAFQIWNDWSSKSDKYSPDECRRKWDSPTDLTGDEITLGTILYHSKNKSEGSKSEGSKKEYTPDYQHSLQFQLRNFYLHSYPDRYWIEHEKTWVALNSKTGHWKSSNLQIYLEMQECATKLVKLIKSNKGDEEETKKLRKSARNSIEKGAAIHSTIDLCKAHRDGSNIKFDTNKHLLGTPNGVLDLMTGRIRKAEKEEYVRRSISYIPTIYQPNNLAKTPVNFLELIDHVGRNDEERDFLLAFLGYALTGETKEEKMLMLIGRRGSGKSTFLQVMNTLLTGEFATDLDPNNLIQGRMTTHKQWLANLQGYRVAMISEFPGRKMDTSYLKILCSGERIKANKMRENDIQFDSQLKLFLHSNFEPRWTTGDGIERRVIVIRMDTLPSKVDVDLKSKIENEKSKILGFLIPYAYRYYQCGLPDIPDRWRRDTEAYIDEQDSVGGFLKQNGIKPLNELGEIITVADLFKEYESHCADTGFKGLGKQTFNRELEKLGFEKVRDTSTNVLEWVNVSRIIENDDETEPF